MTRFSMVQVLTAIIFLSSCSSTPDTQVVLEDSFVVRLATHEEVSRTGAITPSPYIRPDGLFWKCEKDFAVLAIDVTSATGGLTATLIGFDVSGADALFLCKDDFISWWKTRFIYEDHDDHWIRLLDRTYLPDGAFFPTAGRKLYYAVLMGPRPFTRPFTVESRFMVNGEERVFTTVIE